MDDAARIKQLEETNTKLQLALNALVGRVVALERKSSVTSHTLRLTENNVRQLQGTLQTTTQKVSRVENILGRHQ